VNPESPPQEERHPHHRDSRTPKRCPWCGTRLRKPSTDGFCGKACRVESANHFVLLAIIEKERQEKLAARS
jgi:hypothetical protein